MAEIATKESSITDYISDYHDLSISFSTMHLKQKETSSSDNSNMILLDECFIEKYYSDLKDIIINKSLTTDELMKYRCNPWRLSYDLYGTVEYWGLLLDLNNMRSAIEFTQAEIKIYDSVLPEVINTIMSSEEVFINENEVDIDDSYLPINDNNDSDNDSDISESSY